MTSPSLDSYAKDIEYLDAVRRRARASLPPSSAGNLKSYHPRSQANKGELDVIAKSILDDLGYVARANTDDPRLRDFLHLAPTAVGICAMSDISSFEKVVANCRRLVEDLALPC